MEKLKKGDIVYLEYYARWSKSKKYKKNIVTRLTKTRAILDDGIQLINEPKKHRNDDDDFCFSQYGDSWSKWKLITAEMHGIINEYNEDIKITNWWYLKKDKLTLQEVKKIHEILK